jgi:putative transposase
MTAPSSIDPAHLLHEQLAQASPDLLRQMLTTFIDTLMSAEADAVCGADYGQQRVPDQRAQRLPGPGVRYPRQHPRPCDSEAARGLVLPGLAAGVPPANGAGADHRGRHLLPAGCLDPADGEAGGVPGHHPALEVIGQRDGEGSRRAGRADSRHRPLDQGPYTFLAADALVLKVREGGRVVNVHALVATGVNAN